MQNLKIQNNCANPLFTWAGSIICTIIYPLPLPFASAFQPFHFQFTEGESLRSNLAQRQTAITLDIVALFSQFLDIMFFTPPFTFPNDPGFTKFTDHVGEKEKIVQKFLHPKPANGSQFFSTEAHAALLLGILVFRWAQRWTSKSDLLL